MANLPLGLTELRRFGDYLRNEVIPVRVGIVCSWGIVWYNKGRWLNETASAVAELPRGGLPFNAGQTTQGLAVAVVLLLAFLLTT